MSVFHSTETVPLSGVLLVDKPSGPTSHDIVGRLRKKTGIERIGHGGTLDPLASGLLPLFLGDATKISGFIQGHDKSYDFDITLGVTTDTDDSQGKVLSINPIPDNISERLIRETLSRFLGPQLQQPPMFSALKQNGVPLYRLARKGITIDRPARPVTIKSLELISYFSSKLSLRVHCSKGTYVRVLAREIGETLGCGGHVSRLRRLSVGAFSVEDAISFDEIESSRNGENLEKSLIGPEKVFLDLPSVELLPHASTYLQKGTLLPGVWIFRKEGLFHATDTIRIMGNGGRILGLAQALMDSGQTRNFPSGIPIARMVLVFRAKKTSSQGEESLSSWKGDRVLLNNQNG